MAKRKKPLGGKIERQLALALVLTALLPVLSGIWLSRSLLRQSSDRFFVPEIAERLEQSLDLYGQLASAVKAEMRASALAISRLPEVLVSQQFDGSGAAHLRLRGALQRSLDDNTALVSLEILDAKGARRIKLHRGTPLDPASELQLRVERPLPSDGRLVAVFAQPRARFEQREEMSHFFQIYSQMVARRRADENTYLYAFAALLGITIIAAVGVGGLLARGVSNRVTRLAAAVQRVGAGDFDLSVRMGGNDEISELATAFNQMVREVESNRSRIEYLQRLAAWQGMARRLAHEIKNPLTPILLAVQELHQRYKGEDTAYQDLVGVAREIVETEVGTLRRLVTEFSNFARLPKAETKPDDLFVFLRTQGEQLARQEENVTITVSVPDLPARAPVALDRQMFGRVLANLVDNAIQALSDDSNARSQPPQVRIEAQILSEQTLQLYIDDNGPGVAPPLRPTLFDPYVTHKPGGTGLGLAIVKKIVIEHGGRIEVIDSPLGGTRMAVELPQLNEQLPPDVPPESRNISSAASSNAPDSSALPMQAQAPASFNSPSKV